MTSPFSVELFAGHRAVRSAVDRSFRTYARIRTSSLARTDPVPVQERTLRRLLATARKTRFGRDHHFDAIESVRDFQNAVPLYTYEQLWDEYLRDVYPVFDNLTWPGRTPYLALTSGTTKGVTKYIPVTRAMLSSNLKAARTMMAYQVASHPQSRLFQGRHLFLGGSSDLDRPATGVAQGDLSGIMASGLFALMRPYSYPPLSTALEPDWDRKLALLAEMAPREPITVISGVPAWLLVLFERVLGETGKATITDVWPMLEVIVHGGVRFDPYRDTFRQLLGNSRIRLQESYPCSEGFIAFGDPDSARLRLFFDHGIFYEFVPVDELASGSPTRHWLGDVQTGVNYAIVLSTCAGMWSHIVGDTVRFESTRPAMITFTGRTRYGLSAFGEHLINEELEAAMASASAEAGTGVRDWHVGAVFRGTNGHHLFVCEFLRPPADLRGFRNAIDRDLCRRNADYRAHRIDRVGLPLPTVVEVKPGGIEGWMRSRGKCGGQHKFPRMDDSGLLTQEIVAYLRATDQIARELNAEPSSF